MSTISSALLTAPTGLPSADSSSLIGSSFSSASTSDFSSSLDQAKSRASSDNSSSAEAPTNPVKHKKSASKSSKSLKASQSSTTDKSTSKTKLNASDASDDQDTSQTAAGPAEAEGANAPQDGLKAEQTKPETTTDSSEDSKTASADSNQIPIEEPVSTSASTETPGPTTKTKSNGGQSAQSTDPAALATVIAGVPDKASVPVQSGDDLKASQVPGNAKLSPFKSNEGTSEGEGDQTTDAASDTEASAVSSLAGNAKPAEKSESGSSAASETNFAALLPSTSSHASTGSVATAAPLPVAQSAEAQFAQANNPTIVSSIHGQLLPNGGMMSIRLDPPELGAMQIRVKIESGFISASFETSTDQATRLLSHTLADLKSSLEAQGVSVDSLHVHQSSKPDNSPNGQGNSNSDRQATSDQHTADQEQQRREMLRRMWKKVNGTDDPLDLVA